MTQFFDDQIHQEVTVITPEMFEEIINGVRLHCLHVISEMFDSMPDSPACDKLVKYFGLFSGAYHLLATSLMHETGQLTKDEFKDIIRPYVPTLAKFLQEAKTSGEMKRD